VVGQASRLAGLLATHDHRLISSDDRDVIVDSCTRALRPHRLTLTAKKARLATRLHHLPLKSVSINRLYYGGDVRVEPLTIAEDNFLVSLPVAGLALFNYGRQNAELSQQHGAIVSPYERFCFDIDSSFDQIVLRFDRVYVEALCASLANDDNLLPVHFDLPLRQLPEQWAPLLESAAFVAQMKDLSGRQRLFAPIEELIVGSLLLNQPHSRSTDTSRAAQPPLPARIKRAIAYMRDNISEPIKVQDIAAYSGMSIRSLQLGFRQQFVCSPTAWLRAERLNRVHAILFKSEPDATTVANVAFEFGFYHLGDFAAQYRARYGVRPSQTLAKR